MVALYELPAKIIATNRANAEANRIQAVLLPIFEQFVGQPVLKADWSLLAKVKKVLPEFETDHGKRVYFHSFQTMLVWAVSVNEPVGDHRVTYAESYAHIGILNGPVLTSLYPLRPQRTDWTLGKILQSRSAAEAAKKVYDEAKEKCGPFGAD